MTDRQLSYYEFFAGGGMARLGLGDRWECLFANEWSASKANAYRENFPPATELKVQDIWKLNAGDIPGRADLAWASFPCQDLSLAGNGAGLNGARSGTLAKFWSLMRDLTAAGRRVPVIALENVTGALTSNKGNDFQVMCGLAAEAGYRFGAVVIDAARFVPQSRPRLFFIAIDQEIVVPEHFQRNGPEGRWSNARLETAVAGLDPDLRKRWIWWSLPHTPGIQTSLNDVIELDNESLSWHTEAETERLLCMMSPTNTTKINKARAYGKRIVGTIYKRVRSENGIKSQRAEVRFDQISGCLRTPTGGSSRQTIIEVSGASTRSRLITPREAARLMGMPDTYRLPERYNDAYHLAGDGVVVPVVRFLSTCLLEPLVATEAERGLEAA